MSYMSMHSSCSQFMILCTFIVHTCQTSRLTDMECRHLVPYCFKLIAHLFDVKCEYQYDSRVPKRLNYFTEENPVTDVVFTTFFSIHCCLSVTW